MPLLLRVMPRAQQRQHADKLLHKMLTTLR
jgi:hypothetical protein